MEKQHGVEEQHKAARLFILAAVSLLHTPELPMWDLQGQGQQVPDSHLESCVSLGETGPEHPHARQMKILKFKLLT